jgi:HAD superfamily hydrolase (TIGR01509 family)
VIFDLSEVLIAGLLGVERDLSRQIGVPEDEILTCFDGHRFEQLLLGNISEDAYLNYVITRDRWSISRAALKSAIRRNFHHEIPGTLEIVMDLVSNYQLALLSDHAREWISYICSVHSFVSIFDHALFSFDLGGIKSEPATFARALDSLALPAADCLFVDDNPANVAVAESVGLAGICFTGAGQLARALAARGVKGSL